MSRSRVFDWLIPAAVALFLAASPASAGLNAWTSQGPEGGNTQALVVTRGQPSVAYAGVLQGVFKSVDGGRTWRRVSQAIRPQILSLAGDPGDPQTLYAGTTPSAETSLGGAFKTTDGGRTWRHLSLGNQIVTAVAISPAERRTVWAGTSTGLFVSRDAGASWTLVAGVPRTFIWALAAHPGRGRIVYASSQRGFFKTVNGGAGWRRIGAELGAIGPQAVAIDPVHPERIYIGGQFYAGVPWSTDGGLTWQNPATVLSPYEVRALAVDPVSSAVYAAAVGSPGRAYRSLDGGASWRPAGRGLPRTIVLALAVDPARRADLYAGTLAGVWKSADRGASWAPASRGIRQTSVRDIAIDPSTPGTVYATADYAGVFKSTDRGASWRLLGSPDGGLDGGLVHAVAAEPRPSSPALLYAGTDLGIYRSTNGGGSWSLLAAGPAGSINDLALSPLRVLYAATNAGAFRSTDQGETWTLIWPGSGTDGTVRRIVVSPARPADVYLTAPSGIYASFDGGETWTQGNLTLSPFAIVVDPLRPSIVYTSLGGGGLFKSFDNGLTWEEIGSVQPTATITDLAIDPLHPDILYAGTYLGFYRSLDGGASWAPFMNGDGSGPTKVQAVALDPRGPLTLYAGTGENGVFDRTRL
jgi:photosystem II stability/assembly factor-like uncharacterized protein